MPAPRKRRTQKAAPKRTGRPEAAPKTLAPTPSKRSADHSIIAIEGHPGEVPAKPAFWHGAENLFLSFLFAFMMVLPLLDILARKLHSLFDWFPAVLVSGSLGLVQNTVLAIMMFGGAIAAREGKLLQLATTANLIPARFKTAAHIITAGLGGAITLYLVKAGFSLAFTIERPVGHHRPGSSQMDRAVVHAHRLCHDLPADDLALL